MAVFQAVFLCLWQAVVEDERFVVLSNVLKVVALRGRFSF